ncbi:MAG: hypothetical protein D6741_12290 [Planctomycetota bacterium]|nr:MAG: hypothetical protein D6741_12290 [Planctomycetota bacterium]
MQNFGQIESPPAAVMLSTAQKDETVPLGTAPLRSLKPFEKSIVRIECTPPRPLGGRLEATVTVEAPGFPRETFTKTVPVPPR